MASRPPLKLGIILTSIALCSLLFILSLAMSSSVLQSLLFALSPLLLVFLFVSPFFLLEALLIIRPSLDRLSDTLSLSLPFTHDFTISLAQGFGGGVVFLGILFFLQHKKDIFKTPFSLPFFLLLGSGAMTLFYSIEPSRTFYELLRLFSIFFIFLLAYCLVRNEKQLKRLLIIILLSCIIPIITAWVQLLLGIGYTDSEFSIPRIYGTFAHPNILALYLVVASASALLLFFFLQKRLSKGLLLFALGCILLTLILTYSRAAWGTFFVFIGLVTLFKFPKILPLLIFFPLLLFFSSPSIQDRIYDAFEITPSSSLMWRVTIWNDTIDKTYQEGKTLLGYGLNTFEVVAEDLRGLRFVVNDPHSEFVRSFVEGGFVGLAFFLFFSLFPVWVLWKRKNTISSEQGKEFFQRGQLAFLILWCLIIALLLLSFTDHVLRSTMVQWILWAMIGGVLGVYTKKIPQ